MCLVGSLLMATVEFELFFCIWLLAGTLPKPTWAATLCLFGLFTCTSLYKALSGHATCRNVSMGLRQLRYEISVAR
jgi:hypothetical protein